jgi:hypothetical protein
MVGSTPQMGWEMVFPVTDERFGCQVVDNGHYLESMNLSLENISEGAGILSAQKTLQ